MKTKRLFQLARSIENEVGEKITSGVSQGVKKKFVVQEIVKDFFSTYFPEGGSLSEEGLFLSKHMMVGGLIAAKELGWPGKKAAKQLCRGLLQGLTENGYPFLHCANVMTRAAIYAAFLTNYDVCEMLEVVVGIVLKVGREKDINLAELVKSISRSAVDTTKSFPQEDTDPMGNMLMNLLDGKLYIDEDECHQC